jgi:hypothetical protein
MCLFIPINSGTSPNIQQRQWESLQTHRQHKRSPFQKYAPLAANVRPCTARSHPPANRRPPRMLRPRLPHHSAASEPQPKMKRKGKCIILRTWSFNVLSPHASFTRSPRLFQTLSGRFFREYVQVHVISAPVHAAVRHFTALGIWRQPRDARQHTPCASLSHPAPVLCSSLPVTRKPSRRRHALVFPAKTRCGMTGACPTYTDTRTGSSRLNEFGKK